MDQKPKKVVAGKKLILNRETLRHLGNDSLAGVVGGVPVTGPICQSVLGCSGEPLCELTETLPSSACP